MNNSVLIKHIKVYPVLYNNTEKSITWRKKVWENISGKLNTDVPLIKKRWKAIRDAFTQRYRKRVNGDTSKVNHAYEKYDEELQFLTPFIKQKKKLKLKSKHLTEISSLEPGSSETDSNEEGVQHEGGRPDAPDEKNYIGNELNGILGEEEEYPEDVDKVTSSSDENQETDFPSLNISPASKSCTIEIISDNNVFKQPSKYIRKRKTKTDMPLEQMAQDQKKNFSNAKDICFNEKGKDEPIVKRQKNREKQDPDDTDVFFQTMASYAKSLSEPMLSEFKMKVLNAMNEMEARAIKPSPWDFQGSGFEGPVAGPYFSNCYIQNQQEENDPSQLSGSLPARSCSHTDTQIRSDESSPSQEDGWFPNIDFSYDY